MTRRLSAAPPRLAASSPPVLRGVAGQREEHVVERRAADAEVVDPDAGLVEAAHRLDDRAAALADRQRDDAVRRAAARSSAIGASAAHGASASAASLEAHLEPLAADPVLELVRGALGDHPAVVDHRDRVGQPVGLVEVLRGQQHGRARRRRAPRSSSHRLEPAARVEAGGRLVEEQHRRLGDERGGEVEPAAHAARVGLDRAVRRRR